MILSEENKRILIQCSSGLITNEEVANNINKVSFNEFKDLLISIYNEGNQSLFEAVIWCMPNSLSNEELRKIYSKFILLSNHREHENLAGLFQLKFNTEVLSIATLLEAINKVPDYLSPDDFKYPYIRKIIYAIGAQPEPYNIETLEKLANETNDEQIKELALHQIKKRKEFGRWEAAKNVQ